MGLFDKLKEKMNYVDNTIKAIADGEIIDVATVSDNIFSQKKLGESVAFKFDTKKVVLCSPANGRLTALFPTGHAFGITMDNGVEILVHCGIDTVEANGIGFKLCGKKQGDIVKVGEPIVEVDLETLNKKYDMSTIVIITNDNDKNIKFITPRKVHVGDVIICV